MEVKYLDPREKLIVALDTSDEERLLYLVQELDENVIYYKVGLEQYLSSRGKVQDYLRDKNKKVFLDLKFHDIPNTMAAAARVAVSEGVWMFNIHVTGINGMKMVVDATYDEAEKLGIKKPLIIGVTVLTSLDAEDLGQLGIDYTPAETVLKRAMLAERAGLDGVVSSAREAKSIKESCSNSFITVCPGVRPDWAGKGDQKRVMTPGEAVREGADYLVIGRPVTKAEEPEKAVIKILEEMKGAL